MKTLQSRLQSRISKRRNFIRQVENDISVVKVQRHTIREFDPTDSFGFIHDMNETLRDARKLVNSLADDQRLDKRLKLRISEHDNYRSWHGLLPLV